MIYDMIDNLSLYRDLPGLEKIIQFLNQHPLHTLTPGSYQIDGDNLYANVDEYQTFPHSERRFELHHLHTDLQLLISGEEIIQVGYPHDVREELPKEGEGDFYFHQVAPHSHSSLILRPGIFALIPPHHPHRPCLQTAENTAVPIRKIVFKIRQISHQ